ncbi:hypothetical protein B0H14DRAFT_2843855, partial [Mycena olivaceomarginata]
QPVVKANLTGKTVLVLGANTGLGFEATKHFASMNPGRIILACRSQNRGRAAVDKLQAETGYAKGELWLVDLADFDSVKRFTDKFESDGDILVENAAISTGTYNATKDGWETSFVHLSIYSITTELTPKLYSSLQVNDISTPLDRRKILDAPRLVVASEVHFFIEIEKEVYRNPDILKTLSSAEYSTPSYVPSQPDLTVPTILNVFFVRALNARLPPSTPVIINMVNPGFCQSELLRDTQGITGAIMRLFNRILTFTAEEGSRQLVWAAVGGEPEMLQGEYKYLGLRGGGGRRFCAEPGGRQGGESAL